MEHCNRTSDGGKVKEQKDLFSELRNGTVAGEAPVISCLSEDLGRSERQEKHSYLTTASSAEFISKPKGK